MKPSCIGAQLPFLCQKMLEIQGIFGSPSSWTDMNKQKAIEKICGHLNEPKYPLFPNYGMNEYVINFAHYNVHIIFYLPNA